MPHSAARIHSRRTGRSIAAQVFLAEVAIVALVAIIASVIALRANQSQVERLSGERALSIARSVAALTAVRNAFELPEPSEVIQPIAESVRIASGADFVVVANREQVRYSHPDPSKIGQRLSTDGRAVLAGQDFVGTERGTLGLSVRGKTPVFDATKKVIGIVSVGLLVDAVAEQSRDELLRLIAYLCAGALLLGIVGAALVAKRVQRQTFSMDAEAIGSLLEHREAILHSVKEGVVAVDLEGRITLTNGEARRLLGIVDEEPSQKLSELGLSREVEAMFTTPSTQTDQVVVVSERLLAANRRPISIRGQERGAIVTLRDRTELDLLEAELAGTKAVTDTLRAQAHEFSNQLHTIAGLVALEAYDEVKRFIATAAHAHAEADASVSSRIHEPTVAALVIAKLSLARERQILLRLSNASFLGEVGSLYGTDLLLVIGNLIDNALQAVEPSGWVQLHVLQDEVGVAVVVSDSGNGVSKTNVDSIFVAGFSTKKESGHTGLGLALVRRISRERHGTFVLSDQAPTTFTFWMPVTSTKDNNRDHLSMTARSTMVLQEIDQHQPPAMSVSAARSVNGHKDSVGTSNVETKS
jgi:two-component system, CitB family, sensor kinase